MIPKIVHYCWFGKGEMDELSTKCIESWKENLKGYEFKLWNETNFNIDINTYVREAYAIKKYAFVSDYVRVYVLYNYGGIYLDTDVEVINSFDELLINKSFIGFENDHIGTGIIGSIAKTNWLKIILNSYDNENFISLTGNINLYPNPLRFQKLLLEIGLELEDKDQIIGENIKVYTTDVLCAKSFETGVISMTNKTLSIHHFNASWTVKRRSISNIVKTRLIALTCKVKLMTNKLLNYV
ncbi:glycosyltransferase family 32 protein [Siphonobacter sp. SORGH_AS_1065]|uniref:glycosyltransferase family 32 protein n=1 Tax=Siphonobacter sp. SORGH_AS_1065 TaxID=3041795 RepID=UPI00278400F2|nr:glycosyltransferase [Siphonobacter sp. SORGH_AS_1065]MDQ1086637.1 mannosyltransferase OCH1-like enzyme [Siphonobacter sp. SORGH_AS_1065]